MKTKLKKKDVERNTEKENAIEWIGIAIGIIYCIAIQNWTLAILKCFFCYKGLILHLLKFGYKCIFCEKNSIRLAFTFQFIQNKVHVGVS